jgi:hypothetical protein
MKRLSALDAALHILASALAAFCAAVKVEIMFFFASARQPRYGNYRYLR